MVAESVIKFGPYSLTPTRRLLLRDNEPVDIGSRALDVLIALVEAAGAVVGQRELAAKAWPNTVVGEGSLRVTIAGLRKDLGEGQAGVRYIANVTGRGYCFVAPVTRAVLDEPAHLQPPPRARPLPGSIGHRLPAPLTRMVGRDNAVETLSALLVSHRFVSVVGTGGMGKTTVAVSVGYALLEAFGGAVYFVDLGAVTDPALVPSAVAVALGVALRMQDPLPNLLAFLTDRRVLLILDNCEHLVEAASLLTERLYSEAPQGHILTTSREALRAEGEHIHLLAPLDYPPPSDQPTAVEALKTSAVQLFMERAFASGYTTPLTDADAPTVAGICSRLDGIAFAIELAASRTTSYGLQGTANLLDNRFKLLWQGRRSAPPRQQTLTAMLDWSVNLLSDRDKVVLGRLSAFVGVFTLDAAMAVASDDQISGMEVAEAVAGLTDKSLILTTPIRGTLYHKLLDPTIAYAAEILSETANSNATARRHALYFSAFISSGAVKAAPNPSEARSTVELHIGNVRSALEWSFSSAGEAAIGVRLAAAAAPIFFELSLLAEAQRWCEQGLAALPEAGADETLRLALQSTLAASSMFKLGNSDQIRKSLEDCLELAESLGDDLLQIHLLSGLSIALTRTGEFKDAIAVGWRSIPIARRIGTQSAIAISEWMLGVAYHLAGDQAAGQIHLELGRAEANGLDASQVIYFGYDHRVRGLIALARCLWLGGFPDRAAEIARQAVDYAVERNHPVDLCISMIYGATVFLWRSDFDEAEQLIDRLIKHATQHSLGPYQTIGQGLTGDLAIARGETAAGTQILRRALDDMKAFRYQTLASTFQRALADGLLRSGLVEDAASVIEDAVTRCEALAEPLDCELLRLRGKICLSATPQDPASAERSFQQALQQARDQSALSLELRSALELARLWSGQGKAVAAADLLASVRRRFTEGFGSPDLVAADRLLNALGQGLLPECRWRLAQ